MNGQVLSIASLPRNAQRMFTVAFIAVAIATAAGAKEYAPAGAHGDRAARLPCPSGMVVVGFRGRAGVWIDQIGLICTEFVEPSYKTGIPRDQSLVGGTGGEPQARSCPTGTAVTGISVRLLRNETGYRYVRGIEADCAPARAYLQPLGRLSFVAPAHIIHAHPNWEERKKARQPCDPGEHAIGLNVNYGQHVNAVGLICGRVVPPIAVASLAGAENGINRPGQDYDDFELDDDKPAACRDTCFAYRGKCKAWSYVRRGAFGLAKPRCYLKHAVPPPVPDACCISGVMPRMPFDQPGGAAPPVQRPPFEQPPIEQPGQGGLGASEPFGAIGDKYAKLGGANGALGQPMGSEAEAPHGGRCQSFSHGTICWHPQIGEAFGVWGSIGEKWSQVGRTEFGYPITDERTAPDGRGRYNHFRGMQYPGLPEASIYWTPQTGAHAIYGAIRDAWAQQGWERGPLGYPTSDEHQDGKYRRVNFERGLIRWAPDSGVEIGR